MTETNETTALQPGTIVQYRKVGTFRVLTVDADFASDRGVSPSGGCWYFVEPVKCPKRYRDLHERYGETRFWLSRRDVVDGVA